MSSKIQLMLGKIVLSVVAVLTVVSPFLADWNATHIYNRNWPPHAKFHNAQTMSMAVLLGVAALFFLWRSRNHKTDLLAGIMFTGFYWVSQASSFLFPGVAWTDPDLLKPGQSLSDFGIQLKGDAVLLPVIGLCAWLVLRGSSQGSGRQP
jgi:hypothetical protein